MAYIENPFSVGQVVVCVNDNFPIVHTTGDKTRIGLYPDISPKKEEECIIDEILGEFLRFDKYDCNDEKHPDYGWRWWKHTHFKPLKEVELEYIMENQVKAHS